MSLSKERVGGVVGVERAGMTSERLRVATDEYANVT